MSSQELLQARPLQLLHFKKFHPKLQFHDPPDCGGSNDDRISLIRNLELYGEQGSLVYCQIADDFAATNPKVVYDPHPGMIAPEYRSEFHLIASVLPLFSHGGVSKGSVLHRLCRWLLLIRSLSQERLIGEGEVVKEIETFGNVLRPDVDDDI